jgi:hypothetical protein
MRKAFCGNHLHFPPHLPGLIHLFTIDAPHPFLATSSNAAALSARSAPRVRLQPECKLHPSGSVHLHVRASARRPRC